ncbi:hypothetical protein EMIT0P12_110082 [Pseudomonas sp. IT-P12]
MIGSSPAARNGMYRGKGFVV